MPFTWDEVGRRRHLVRAYRSWAVSAYMKSVRLGRVEDAMYWYGVLYRGRAGTGYLARRLLASAGEDNLDVSAMLVCESVYAKVAALKTDEAAPDSLLTSQWWGVYVSTLGTKWYERADGRDYTRARIHAGTREGTATQVRMAVALEAEYAEMLARGNVAGAYASLEEATRHRVSRHPFFALAVRSAVGRARLPEATRLLAELVERQTGWMAKYGELNFLWQLIWHLAARPFERVPRDLYVADFEAARGRVLRRLDEEIEPVPAWALDGIHTSGNDPRFAGSWEGLANMIAMYERDGTLDPANPGATLHVGQKRRRA